jgi:hypothetical protein
LLRLPPSPYVFMVPFLFPLAHNFLQSCSTFTPATPVGKTVETFLAPDVHIEEFEVNDDNEGCTTVNMRGQKVKGKATVLDETVEPLSRSNKCSRGRRAMVLAVALQRLTKLSNSQTCDHKTNYP